MIYLLTRKAYEGRSFEYLLWWDYERGGWWQVLITVAAGIGMFSKRFPPVTVRDDREVVIPENLRQLYVYVGNKKAAGINSDLQSSDRWAS